MRRRPAGVAELDAGSGYQWRRDGEYHLFNPETVFKLQHATRSGQRLALQGIHASGKQSARASCHAVDSSVQAKRSTAVPIEKVEPVENIVKRFATGAMSRIDQLERTGIAIAMNRLAVAREHW